MKMIIVVALALVAAANAQPVNEPTKIIRSEFNQDPEGSYVLGFETDDGTARQEEGTLKEAFDEDNKPHKVVVVRGSYTYINSEGKSETVNYFADETGYHAEGDSIPKPVSRR